MTVEFSEGSMNGDLEITEAMVFDFFKRFEEAQGTASFASVVDMIHPDALFRFNDGDYSGLDAIRGAFESTWAQDVQDERYYLTDIKVMCLDTNSATATFRFNWTGIGPQGRFHIVGRGTSLLLRHDGKLKILVEHLSR